MNKEIEEVIAELPEERVDEIKERTEEISALVRVEDDVSKKPQTSMVITAESEKYIQEKKARDEISMRKLFKHEKKLYQLCKNKRSGSFNRRRSILRTVQVLRKTMGLKEVELRDYI